MIWISNTNLLQGYGNFKTHMPSTPPKNSEHTTFNLFDGTPEYKNKLTTPRQYKFFQIYLKNLNSPYMFIIVETGQGLYSQNRKTINSPSHI